VLTATTLLVPYYVDKIEIEEIARFISRQNKDIPYSLLVFHPDFLMTDLPVTPRTQARECLEAARRQLSRVNLGNTHLLGPGGLWA
jgi:pyruvate formate lyase activating enzyme